MNKVLKKALSVAAVAAMSANAYTLWNLEDGVGAIAILGSGDQGGALYGYDDRENNGGGSRSDLPDGSTERDVLGPWLLDKNGTIHFTTTADYEYSFAGLGFNWLDPEGHYNAESHGGISVCYTSEKAMIIDLKTVPGDIYAYNSFVVTLPAAATPTHRSFAWSAFKQGDWGGTGDEPGGISNMFSNYSAGVQFKLEGQGAAVTNTFRIGGLGWLNDADDCANQLGGGGSSILSGSKMGGFSIAQAGRTLSVNGLNANSKTTVEIINIQGALVAKESISATKNSINLSKLPIGIYMVRISSGSQNFTQKVLLK